MKHQALFSSKNKSKNFKVSSAAILLGALRVKDGFGYRVCATLLIHSAEPPGEDCDKNLTSNNTVSFCLLVS